MTTRAGRSQVARRVLKEGRRAVEIAPRGGWELTLP